MKIFKIFFVFIFLGVTLLAGVFAQQNSGSWSAPERASRRKNPVAPNQECIAAGKATYTKLCEKCHGLLGKGDGPKAQYLETKPHDLTDPAIQKQSDGAFFWKITEGKKPMPTFESKLSETERWQVINYIRTLAKKN